MNTGNIYNTTIKGDNIDLKFWYTYINFHKHTTVYNSYNFTRTKICILSMVQLNELVSQWLGYTNPFPEAIKP